jgi:hypothetical protein
LDIKLSADAAEEMGGMDGSTFKLGKEEEETKGGFHEFEAGSGGNELSRIFGSLPMGSSHS